MHRTLIDLRDSVNLLPFTKYEMLGPGELKPPKMLIQVVDKN